ncbi:hypothetical protein AYI69_g10776 [Smittium culicis]|uniref:Uncharacterized protein n=1 Tax=Smittium culicis TaxID=133412 RepID=A0A1R1X3P2_9FUNG|nr:hypothetical protein AYI69_g10776 [Smittium culicis]
MNLLLNNKNDNDFIDIDLVDPNGSLFSSNKQIFQKNIKDSSITTKYSIEDSSEDETVTSTTAENTDSYPNFSHSLDHLNNKIFKEHSDTTSSKFCSKYGTDIKSSFSENFSQSSESLFEDFSMQNNFRNYNNNSLDVRFDNDLSTSTRLGQ